MSDNRTESLSDIRAIVDSLHELCDTLRAGWTDRYPIPHDLNALLTFQEQTLERVRSGQLRNLTTPELDAGWQAGREIARLEGVIQKMELDRQGVTEDGTL